nr:unnamed protein product [Digitaria exilis]
MDDAPIATAGGTCAAGEFGIWDVVLWRRGRADVSACLLAATAASWLLFYGPVRGGGGYTALSLASDVLLLLLTVLFVWAKAARLLNRPAPPVPELRVSRRAVDEAAALLRAALDAAFSGFHDIATGRDSLLFFRKYQERIDRYMRFAYKNLRMYEMVYERLSMKCFVRVRDLVMEVLKDP